MEKKFFKVIKEILKENKNIPSDDICNFNNITLVEIDIKSQKIIWFSNNFFDVLGINDNKYVNIDRVLNLIKEEYRDDFWNKIIQSIHDGKRFYYSLKIKRELDSKIREIELIADIKKNKNNEAVKIFITLNDITDSRKISEEKQLSNIVCQILYNKSPYGIALVDSITGEIYNCNKRYKDFWMINECTSSFKWMKYTHPDDINNDLKNMRDMNNGLNEGFVSEKRCLREDGSLIWLRLAISPIHLNGIRTNKHICIAEDITEMKDSMEKRNNTIYLMMNTLFEKSERESTHSQRVGEISAKIAKHLGFDEYIVGKVRTAGYLHDIGKIGVDDAIIKGSRKLNDEEREAVMLHTVKGSRILEQSLEYHDIHDIVLYHHEKFDGSGYPEGIAGEDIPIESRIITIADSYDAMTKDREYRDNMTNEEALAEIKKCSGSHFDPEIVEIFINNFDEIII